MWPSIPKKTREIVKGRVPQALTSARESQQGRWKVGQARGHPLHCRTVRLDDEYVAPDARGDMWPGHRKAVEARSVDEKESSKDKSSSLDSNKDLDTAVKDLLGPKQKLKKRCRDRRAVCRKVRFCTTKTWALVQWGGFQRGCKDRSPHLLKSCLSKFKRDSREDPLRKPASSAAEQREQSWAALGPHMCPWPSCQGKEPAKGMCSARWKPATFTAQPPAPTLGLMTAIPWTVMATSS